MTDRETLARVADAIEQAQCPNREGPYGLYDYTSYGHPKPHHVRDFRDPKSETWGHAVLTTTDREEAEATYKRLTREHVAKAAIAALRASTQGGEDVDDDHPVLAAILRVRHRNAGNFAPSHSGALGEARDLAIVEVYKEVKAALSSKPTEAE